MSSRALTEESDTAVPTGGLFIATGYPGTPSILPDRERVGDYTKERLEAKRDEFLGSDIKQ